MRHERTHVTGPTSRGLSLTTSLVNYLLLCCLLKTSRPPTTGSFQLIFWLILTILWDRLTVNCQNFLTVYNLHSNKVVCIINIWNNIIIYSLRWLKVLNWDTRTCNETNGGLWEPFAIYICQHITISRGAESLYDWLYVSKGGNSHLSC